MAIDGPLILNNMDPVGNFFYEQFYYLFYDVCSSVAGILYFILAARLLWSNCKENMSFLFNVTSIAKRQQFLVFPASEFLNETVVIYNLASEMLKNRNLKKRYENGMNPNRFI